ncbi:MAG: hypothetical protein WKF87_13540 [Chryseolinea sp.]
MTRTKKWFALMALLFVILLAYVSYDISSRTSFPGSKSQLKERLKKNYLAPDTLAGDSSSLKELKKE